MQLLNFKKGWDYIEDYYLLPTDQSPDVHHVYPDTVPCQGMRMSLSDTQSSYPPPQIIGGTCKLLCILLLVKSVTLDSYGR